MKAKIPGITDISIHALREESDSLGGSSYVGMPLFLSTLSVRRATRIIAVVIFASDNFYPRSP